MATPVVDLIFSSSFVYTKGVKLATQNLMKSYQGYTSFRGYKTWYEIHGDLNSGKPPLAVLHGGPGIPHEPLENLSQLAANGYAVTYGKTEEAHVEK